MNQSRIGDKMKGICSTYPNPDLWFPEMPQGKSSRAAYAAMVGRVSLAVSMCNRCPVKTECLVEGMRTEKMFQQEVHFLRRGDNLKSTRRRTESASAWVSG